MKRNKILAWALVLALICLLAACGQGTTDSNSNGSSTSATTTTTGNNSTTTTTTTSSTTQQGETTTTTKPTEPSVPPVTDSVNLKDKGAKGDGQTNDAAALQAAVNAVKNGGKIYIPGGSYVIGSAVTVPANVGLVFERGAVLNIAEKVTLTLNGFVVAGDYLIFSGNGTVAGSAQTAGCPQWFGAKGDSATDDTAAFQKAVDVFPYVRVPFPAGKYLIRGTVTISKPVQLIGEGTSRVELYIVSTLSANEKAFVIQSSNVLIQNLKISGGQSTEAASSSTIFYLDCSKNNLSNIEISDIWSGWTAMFLKDSQTSGKSITNVTLKNLAINYCYYATGIHMTNFKSGIYIKNVAVNQVGMTANMVNKPLWIIENCEGLVGDQLDVAGGYSFPETGYTGYGGDGIVFKNCSNVKVERFMADYINGYCTKMINCKNFDLVNWVCSLYEDGAVYMENCTDNKIDVIKLNGIRGSKDISTHPGTALVMKNCRNNSFVNMIFQNNLSHCMEVVDCTENLFKNVVYTWNDGFCYKESGTSNGNKLVGATFERNSGTAIEQIGANSACIGIAIGTDYYAEKVGKFTA